jgi:Holliday junction resolvase-like predicted endonuclease
VVSIDGRRVAIEVKTSVDASAGDPLYHFDTAKQRQVRALANRLRANRVDYVGVHLGSGGVTVQWLPDVC